MANKNKKFEFRLEEDFFNEMEIYKNRHNINWSSKIRAFIESEMKNDINSIQEIKKEKENINPLLDRDYTFHDMFIVQYNSNKIDSASPSFFTHKTIEGTPINGIQFLLVFNNEKIVLLDDNSDYSNEENEEDLEQD